MAQHLLDKIDLTILRELNKDASISRQRLCDLTGLSASGLSKRLSYLIKQGVIRKYTVDINFESIGLPVTALLLVKLRGDSKTFERQISEFPNVTDAESIMGSIDFCLRVVCDTNQTLMEITQDVMSLDTVEEVETFPIISKAKNERSKLFQFR
jgi:Lrp/AsnC family leucine-responsive transcriptional regulator